MSIPFFRVALMFLVRLYYPKTMRPSQRIHNLFGASEPFSKAQFPTFGDVGKQASRDKEEMHCNETGKKKKMTMRPDKRQDSRRR